MSRNSQGPRWSQEPEEPEETTWPAFEELPPGRRRPRRSRAGYSEAEDWRTESAQLKSRGARHWQGRRAAQDEVEIEEEEETIEGQEDLLMVEEDRKPPYDDRRVAAYRRRRRQRRGPAWLWWLGGCTTAILLLLIGIMVAVFAALQSVTGSAPLPIPGLTSGPYTQTSQQTIPINDLAQLKVSSQIGSIDIAVDPDLSVPELTIIKHTKAGGQDEANEEFKRIAVQVQPGPTSLQVTATLSQSESLKGSSDSVDLRFRLPAQVNQSATPFQLSVELAVGDIHIQGLKGVLVLNDEVGNITVEGATLSDGSSLRTVNGQVTFNGSLDTRTVVGSGKGPLFQIHSELGQLDITLPASTAVVLSAYVNSGKIVSAFPIQVSTNAGSATYYGPLVPGSGPAPTAVLRLDVGTGTINLHSA